MRNYVQPGVVLDLTAPTGGVTSGVAVQIGQLLGIPAVTAAEGETFACQVVGVFDVPKTAAEAWTEGALVYFDSAAGEFTTVSTGNLLAGAAVAAAAGADATGRIRLNGVAQANSA